MINAINQEIYTDRSSNYFELSVNLVELQRKIRTIINIIGDAGGKSELDVLSMQVGNITSYLFFTVPAGQLY